jgi:Tol biopolymer transport system component
VYEANPGAGSARDLWVLPMVGDRTPRAAVATSADESDGRFSPDGEWLAYTSNQSGRYEVYLQRILPTPGQRLPVSTNGGLYPRWRADGRELYYVTPDRDLMAVDIEPGNTPRLGLPERLFELPISAPDTQPFTTKYAVSRDGQRFIVHRVADDQEDAVPLTVIVNWHAVIKK